MDDHQTSRTILSFLDRRLAFASNAVLRLVRHIPPAWLRSLPLTGLRLLALRTLNLSLRRYPRTFQTTSLDGRIIAGTTRDMIQRYIYIFGVWEPDVTSWVRSQLRPGSLVVDVGANIGYYSTLAASIVGDEGEVVAVECVPSIVSMLERNIELNHLSNVTVRAVALGDEEGTTAVFRGGDENIGTSSTMGQGSAEAVVRVRTLDSVLEKHDLSRISFIKIDVEGDEFRVLRGAVETLRALPKGAAVLVEVTPLVPQTRGDSTSLVSEMFPPTSFDALVVENKYSVDHYNRRQVSVPVPWTGEIDSQVDMIFVKR